MKEEVFCELPVAYGYAKDFIEAYDLRSDDTSLDNGHKELSTREWGRVIGRLKRSGTVMSSKDAKDLDDLVLETAFGIEMEPIGPEKLATAIVAGGWTYTWCSIMNTDC